ncbi:MAG TPA: nucleotidyltransferase domain-containing protein [Armatimonadota bacterium]|nr:nucleotidyltransferase domain-containing protein [Armatimonadota bacterium]
MEQLDLKTTAEEARKLLGAYLRERIAPHPILSRYLPDAAVLVAGSVAAGTWDEHSDFDIRLLLPDEDHTRLAAELQEAHLWEPGRDFRVHLVDREPFRRFPSADILAFSASQLDQELRFDLPVALWAYTHAAVLQDPLGTLDTRLEEARARFEAALPALRCEHYFRFRQARNDLVPRIMPRRLLTVLAIKRGEAVQEALRLAFLAEGKPYPYDKWLEVMAERETDCGSGIVTAVRALVAARETHTVEHASKVLRDRVAFALQQNGVTERWLEQWWLWPAIAPTSAR